MRTKGLIISKIINNIIIMFKKISKYVAGVLLAFSPAVAFAEGKTLKTLIDLVVSYLNMILVLLMGVGIVIFVFYVVKYFVMPNADRTEAGKYVMYSVIGFFIILSFWGIVNILQNTFGLKNETYRPAGWASFVNLFPGNSGGGNGGDDSPDCGNGGIAHFTDDCN